MLLLIVNLNDTIVSIDLLGSFELRLIFRVHTNLADEVVEVKVVIGPETQGQLVNLLTRQLVDAPLL